MLATQHFLDLRGLDFDVERLEPLSKFGVHGLALLRPFPQDRQILALPSERCDELAILFEPAAALQDFLRFGLVFPEIGRGGARLEAGQLFVGLGGFKDNSAGRRLAC
jgi:hypothetical protein